MNREIKFRAWCKHHKYMYDVCSMRFISDKISTNDNVSCLGKEILMQYTGLKDNNGIEIYEGDIVETIEGLMTIIYLKDSFQCVHCGTKKNYRLFDFVYSGCIYVKGNIHQNPELLEEDK